ncbi:TetR/AcrR family transcriptional regulator [Nocardia harenae]|uniref:TetR/AcrR family transcriptional regulator n=1 Tax=Nocardia harenae TaxID=358707 RepID=UPI000829EF67|nr:TetR/AcrR family transcriptional regulator [Nocardia harenae]
MTEPKLPRTRRSSAHRTIARILEAAQGVFAERGYAGTEVIEIAEAAKISRTTFYLYFESKHAVLRELITAQLPDMSRRDSRDAAGGRELSPFERIEAANRAYLEAYRRNIVLMKVWAEAALQSPEFQDLLIESRLPFVLRSAHYIRELQLRGLADTRLDADSAAHALTGMVAEYAHTWFVEGAERDLEQSVETLTRLWAGAIGLSGSAAERTGAGPAEAQAKTYLPPSTPMA